MFYSMFLKNIWRASADNYQIFVAHKKILFSCTSFFLPQCSYLAFVQKYLLPLLFPGRKQISRFVLQDNIKFKFYMRDEFSRCNS